MDTVFYNGVIHTMAGRTVSALAVQNGRIALVGTDEAALALADAHTKKIDLGGRCVLPGFTDSHMHILQAGMVCHRLDLRGVTSLQEIIDRGQDYVKHADLAPGEWIIGYGFDHNRFDPPTLPDGATAEAISSDLPVILDRVCGHIGAANRKAFALAGYDENTVIPGGELDKDEHGHLNGIIREAALDQIKRSSPRQTKEQVIARIQEIGTQLAAAGLTSVHSDDVGMEGTKWPILKEAFADMEAENSCPVRLWEEWEAPRPADLQWVLTQPLRSGQGSDWLKVGNIKLISDGSLGARTAYLREDYSDDPGNRGIAVYTQEAMDEMVALCHAAGLQVACHAIGDGACEAFVNAVEKAMIRDPKPLCHRVVHCQFGDEALYRRMAALGMGADIQPAFVPSDAPLLPSCVGAERAKTSYAWKTLLDLGVVLGGGSDTPVEDLSPLWGIHCAVNRPASHTDNTPFLPEQALTVEEAVALYTTGPARLAGAEQDLGTLEAGKWADLVVLDQDIFTVPKETIKDIPVALTMVGGRVSFAGEAFV